MSKLTDSTDPTTIDVECFCGRLIVRQPLPAELRQIADEDAIWLHDDGMIQCYPYSLSAEEREAVAEPVDP